MKIGYLLKAAQDRYGIVGKELASKVGISTNHLSQIRNGKVWPSEEVFVRILESMDEMEPGSRAYFCTLLAGAPEGSLKKKSAENWNDAVARLDDEEVNEVLLAISRRIRVEDLIVALAGDIQSQAKRGLPNAS